MPRARSLKPGFFANEDLIELAFEARLLFAGLWTLADREGRLEDRPKKIKLHIFPGDDVDVNAALDALAKSKFIVRYKVREGLFIQISKWQQHQRPHHMEEPSKCPPPPGGANRYNHSPITKEQRQRIMERDQGKCRVCGSAEDPHLDHVVPVSRGGDSSDGNLRILCGECNLSKGKKTEEEWISSRSRVDIKSRTTQEQPEQVGPRRSSLTPSSLTPSSLTPDSPFPITDSSSLRSPEVAQKRDPSPVERVFEHWRTEHRHPKAQLDAKRRRRISEALKSYAEADLCLAISGYKNSPHHMGQNDTSTVFDSLELFLRDAEHIDAGLKFARGPPSAPKSAVELARERLRNGSSDERVVGEQSGGSVGPAPRLLRG